MLYKSISSLLDLHRELIVVESSQSCRIPPLSLFELSVLGTFGTVIDVTIILDLA